MVAEFVTHYWQQIIAVFAFVAWAFRLEAKVNDTTRELKRLEKKQEDTERARAVQRSEDMNSIQFALRDIQADIKEILRSGKG